MSWYLLFLCISYISVWYVIFQVQKLLRLHPLQVNLHQKSCKPANLSPFSGSSCFSSQTGTSRHDSEQLFDANHIIPMLSSHMNLVCVCDFHDNFLQ